MGTPLLSRGCSLSEFQVHPCLRLHEIERLYRQCRPEREPAAAVQLHAQSGNSPTRDSIDPPYQGPRKNDGWQSREQIDFGARHSSSTYCWRRTFADGRSPGIDPGHAFPCVEP